MSSAQRKLRDVESISYFIHITVSDVDQQLNERLCVRIEKYLRGSAEQLIIATLNTVPTTFDFSCAIRYPIAIKRENLRRKIRSIQIPLCFEEPGIGKRTVHVDVEPIESEDGSAFERQHGLWSNNPPWNIIYKGPGAASSLYISLIGRRLPLPFQFP
jgi:hypothetical protein